MINWKKAAKIFRIRINQLDGMLCDAQDKLADLREKYERNVDILQDYVRQTAGIAYMAPVLDPMFKILNEGNAKNFVSTNFVTHKEEKWALILQREEGKTPKESMEEWMDNLVEKTLPRCNKCSNWAEAEIDGELLCLTHIDYDHMGCEKLPYAETIKEYTKYRFFWKAGELARKKKNENI